MRAPGARDGDGVAPSVVGDDALSAVILTCRRPETLRRTLDGLGRQDVAPAEVIVVVNGPPDGVPADLRQEFPRVRWLDLGENRGIAGRNEGVRAASRPLVLTLDDDIELLRPDATRRILDAFRRHPALGALSLKICEDPEGARYVPHHWWHPCAREAGEHAAFETDHFNEAAVVFRRDLFLRAGGYHEPLFWGGEEWDIALAIQDLGAELWYAPEPVLHLAPRGSLDRVSTDRHARNVRNRLWIALRRLPPGAMLAFAAPRLLVWGGRAVRHGYVRHYLRGIGGVLVRLPRILTERRPVRRSTLRRIRELRRRARSHDGSGAAAPGDGRGFPYPLLEPRSPRPSAHPSR